MKQMTETYSVLGGECKYCISTYLFRTLQQEFSLLIILYNF